MVNVVSKRCERDGCDSRPTFNVKGGKPRVCAAHKEAGMVNVRVSKRCERDGCETSPSYGLPGTAPSFCVVHHPAGTMRNPKRKCHCKAVATHGITLPERCEQHRLSGDDNLVERDCANCMLPFILDAAGLCADCSAWITGKRPRLAKQREVLQFLDYECSEFPYDLTDRTPQVLRDCDRRERPDVLWDRPDRIVILEVDEDQHKDRLCSCEQARMMNVSQALGCERTVWIRFNPDSFSGPNARRWPTRKRHELLKKWLTWALTRELPYTISVVYLFFDGFDEGSVGVQEFL